MINMEKLQEMLNNEETKKALTACGTDEEILAFMHDKGIEITTEELNAIMPKPAESMNLDDMDAIAGGSGEGTYGMEYASRFLDAWDGLIHGKWKKDTDVIATQEQADGSTLSVLRNGTMKLEKTLENGTTVWQNLDEHGKPVGSIGFSYEKDGFHSTMKSF